MYRIQACFVLFIVFALEYSKSAPAPGNEALLYLSQYGYLPKTRSSNSSALLDESALKRAVSDFQSFAGLEVTGELDNTTFETMQLPRCGVKDKVGTGDNRAKRYALQGSRWKVKNLTYRILKYPKNLKQSEVDREIQKAFDVWTHHTDLNFRRSAGNVHIEIRFERGEHGDGDPFDGPGGTLAHAYFPVFGGDAHFDAAENWSIDSYRGTNLFQVAAHEFGHSLGLSHSDVREALMAPFYRGFDPAFELNEDDISGIQVLYGKKTSAHPDTGFDESKGSHPVLVPAPSASVCQNAKIDTIFMSAEGETYIFRGDQYWKVNDDAIEKGYPQKIASRWPNLPANINAAFTYKNGKTYFFKGSKYWRYIGNKIDGDYPKDISDGFTGIPDNIDTAMVWSGNGKIYFFKGLKFWRFDPTSKPPVKNTYPKLISNWKGLPNNLDAAFQWKNGYTYFYKDEGYYRFNDREFAVDGADPAFPRSIAYWWLGCAEASKGTIGTSESRGYLVNGDSNDGDVAGSNDMDTGDYHAQESGTQASDRGLDSGSKDITASVILILALGFYLIFDTSC